VKPNEQALAARKRRRNLLALLGVLALVLLSVATFKSYRDLEVGRAREAELRGQIGASEGRIEELERRVTRLEDDPATLEELAREELLMARPGEIVIVLPAGAGGGAPPAGGGEGEVGMNRNGEEG